MENNSFLSALGVDKSNLSRNSQNILKELVKFSEILRISPNDLNFELATIEKLTEYNSLISLHNSELNFLSIIQSTLKKSFLMLHELDSQDSFSGQKDSDSLINSLENEEKELKSRLGSFKNIYYDEELDHKNLMKLADECENITKDLMVLQSRSELYGDFPTVTF